MSLQLSMNIKELVGVIDIGSNSLRLMVYDALDRAPVRIFSERNLCGLGRDLGTTGKLNPDGVKAAMNSFARFSGLIQAMKIKHVFAVATASLRDAKDGAVFVKKVKDKFDIDIQVIHGEEEARLSALGVLANGLGENGIIGDFGGGSLELIGIQAGKIKHQVTLPLGSLRIQALKNKKERLAYIEGHLKSVEFLKEYKGTGLYALGGSWRSMARTHMHMSKYPIQVLDHYMISGRKAHDFAELVSLQSLQALERMAGLPQRRVKDMSSAALVLERVLNTLRPKEVGFSATGLREGVLFDQLSPSMKRQDPLIYGCRKLASQTSRFIDEKALMNLSKWMAPLFKDMDPEMQRMQQAACLLSDFGWFEHENFQAEHAFSRIMTLPVYGLNHFGRAVLAISVYVRHKGYIRQLGREDNELTEAAQKLLSKKELEQAAVIGLALRVAYMITGGALVLLKYTELKMTDKTIRLILKDQGQDLKGDIIQSALDALAKPLKRKAVISRGI